jgi:hypothetical protein
MIPVIEILMLLFSMLAMCRRSLFQTVRKLIELGADVNAVAKVRRVIC